MSIIDLLPDIIVVELFVNFLELRDIARLDSAFTAHKNDTRGNFLNLISHPSLVLANTNYRACNRYNSLRNDGVEWILLRKVKLSFLDFSNNWSINSADPPELRNLLTEGLVSVKLSQFHTLSNVSLTGFLNSCPKLKEITMENVPAFESTLRSISPQILSQITKLQWDQPKNNQEVPLNELDFVKNMTNHCCNLEVLVLKSVAINTADDQICLLSLLERNPNMREIKGLVVRLIDSLFVENLSKLCPLLEVLDFELLLGAFEPVVVITVIEKIANLKHLSVEFNLKWLEYRNDEDGKQLKIDRIDMGGDQLIELFHSIPNLSKIDLCLRRQCRMYIETMLEIVARNKDTLTYLEIRPDDSKQLQFECKEIHYLVIKCKSLRSLLLSGFDHFSNDDLRLVFAQPNKLEEIRVSWHKTLTTDTMVNIVLNTPFGRKYDFNACQLMDKKVLKALVENSRRPIEIQFVFQVSFTSKLWFLMYEIVVSDFFDAILSGSTIQEPSYDCGWQEGHSGPIDQHC